MKRTAVHTFIFCIMLMIASGASAQDVRSNFKAANKYYLSKQYEEAEKLYLLVIRKDRKNVNALYNLGNTCFHLKKYPEALLYYEKAKKLNPEDKAIQQNIAITTNKLLSKIEFSKEFFVTKWVKSKVTSRSSASWAIWMLVCLWSGVLLFVAYLRTTKSTYRKIGSIALLLAAVFSVFTYRTYRNEQQQNFAIIMLENAYMKKAPVESMNAAAALPAGLKVEILDSDKNWYKIRQPNGKTGWIEKSWLELI
jgi:hypothetical protein